MSESPKSAAQVLEDLRYLERTHRSVLELVEKQKELVRDRELDALEPVLEQMKGILEATDAAMERLHPVLEDWEGWLASCKADQKELIAEQVQTVVSLVGRLVEEQNALIATAEQWRASAGERLREFYSSRRVQKLYRPPEDPDRSRFVDRTE